MPLAGGKPGEILVKGILIEGVEIEQIAAGVSGRQTHGAETGTLIDHASDDLPESEFSLPVGSEGMDDAEFLSEALEDGDGANAEALAPNNIIRDRGGIGSEVFEMVFMFEGETDGGDFLRGALGEVGDGAVLDLALIAEGFTKQDARVDLGADTGFAEIEVHSDYVYYTPQSLLQ